MQFQIYRTENSIDSLKPKLRKGIPILLSVLALSTLSIILELIPLIYALINSISCIVLILLFRKFQKTSSQNVYLKLEDDYLEYFSEEREEMVQIPAENIAKIITRFCELQIHTHDNSVHRISMKYIKKEQTRWEVKEMIKQLAHINSFSTAS